MQIHKKNIKILARNLLLLFLLLFSYTNGLKAQLVIKDNYSYKQAQDLIQKYFSNSGIIINSVTFLGDAEHSFGNFSGGVSSNLGINEGFVISNGNVSEILGNAADTVSGNLYDVMGFPALNALLSPGPAYDANIISINFTPLTDTVWFRYVFASEEFLPFSEISKDVFGFFITGQAYNNKNIALFPKTTTEIRIDSITSPTFSQYYRSNVGGSIFKFNGYTTVLTAICPVEHCKTYTLDIAIGDARQNHNFDSGLFLEAGSFSSTHYSVTVKGNNGDNGMVEKCGTASFIFTRDTVTSTPYTLNFEIGGTALNGTDYEDSLGGNMPNFVIFEANQKQAKINIKANPDNISETTETIIVKLTGAGFSQCISDTVKATLLLKNTDDLTVKAIGDTTVCNESGGIPTLTAIITGGVKPFKVYWLEGISTDTTTAPQGEISQITLPTYSAKEEKPFYLYHALVIDSCKTEFISNEVKVTIKCPIKTTNVITPNGDSYNDRFIIKHLIEYPNSQLVILNRWGKKVFETNNYQNDWDGGNLSDGVYFFIIKLSDGTKYQGSVTIIR